MEEAEYVATLERHGLDHPSWMKIHTKSRLVLPVDRRPLTVSTAISTTWIMSEGGRKCSRPVSCATRSGLGF
jgi:hypothetical protein